MKRYIRSDIVDINDEDYDLIYELARVGNNARELSRLAKSPNARIREWVAKNPNTSVDTLWQMANDTHIGVRSGIYYNTNAPEDLKDYIKKNRGSHSGYYEFIYYLWYPERLSEEIAHNALSELAHSLARQFGADYIVRNEQFYDSYPGRVVFDIECGPFSDDHTSYRFHDAMKNGIDNILNYELDYTESEDLVE